MKKDCESNDDKSWCTPNPSDILQLFLAEYNALRREIEILVEHQKDITNFSILTIAAMVGLVGILETNKELQSFSYVYLVFPWIFLLLMWLYADKTVRILRVADYIHNYLRETIKRSYKEQEIWQWESYKSDERSFKKKLALWLDRTRWWIFLLPSVASIILFLMTLDNETDTSFRLVYYLIIILYFVVLGLTMYLIWPLEETAPFGKGLEETASANVEKQNPSRLLNNNKNKLVEKDNAENSQ